MCVYSHLYNNSDYIIHDAKFKLIDYMGADVDIFTGDKISILDGYTWKEGICKPRTKCQWDDLAPDREKVENYSKHWEQLRITKLYFSGNGKYGDIDCSEY